MKASLLLLSIFFAASGAAEELGRLFFTPQERARLDALAADAEVPAIRFDGLLIGRGNTPRIWLNGQPASPPAAKELAVGDTLLPSQMKTRPLIPRGSLIIHRP